MRLLHVITGLQLLQFLSPQTTVQAFSLGPLPSQSFVTRISKPLQSSTLEDISQWKVADLRAELQQRGISYADCFDKDSLVQKLRQARDNHTEQSTDTPTTLSPHSDTNTGASSDTSLLEEIRSMKVKELREELSSRNMRWAGLLEKEDLVKAVYQARIQAALFSSSGLLRPGQVVDLTGSQALDEAHDKDNAIPLLLDVYAVWCGPCQLMAQELTKAAQVWQANMRVAKFDSDKYPKHASRLRVNGLPTLVLFHRGHEVARLEGALPHDKLQAWVEHAMKNEA
jgi:thiol-disulfide isomerase/thioredoxin